MITIIYKPSTRSESQAFLQALASALDPLDEVRKKEMEEAEKENLPGMGGAIEDVINMASNPLIWQISETIIKDILIPTLVALFVNQFTNKESKKLEIKIDNSKKVIINMNDYTNSINFENDLENKLLKGK